ncbi:MAG: hypothetical protein ACRDLS_04010, partial [Solirubrobacteraceae bacterium]
MAEPTTTSEHVARAGVGASVLSRRLRLARHLAPAGCGVRRLGRGVSDRRRPKLLRAATRLASR